MGKLSPCLWPSALSASQLCGTFSPGVESEDSLEHYLYVYGKTTNDKPLWLHITIVINPYNGSYLGSAPGAGPSKPSSICFVRREFRVFFLVVE